MHDHDQFRRVGAVLFSIGHVYSRNTSVRTTLKPMFTSKNTGPYNPETYASPGTAVSTGVVHLPNTGSGVICTNSFCCEAIYQHKIMAITERGCYQCGSLQAYPRRRVAIRGHLRSDISEERPI